MDFATKKLSSSLEKADEPKSLLHMGPIKTISDNFVKIKFSTVASRRKTAKFKKKKTIETSPSPDDH